MKRSSNQLDGRPEDYQISRFDIGGEHWYRLVHVVDQTRHWLNSVTKYTGHYPKGPGFDRWLTEQGNYGKAVRARDDAADKGNNVHAGFERIAHGEPMRVEEFTVEEQLHLEGLRNWFEDFQPEVLGFEEMVFSLRNRVAGTLDLRCKIDRVECVMDLKSGKNTYRSHEVQVNEYGVMSRDLGSAVQVVGLLRTGADNAKKYAWQSWPICQKTHELFEALLVVGRDFDRKTEPKFPKSTPLRA